MQSSNYKNDLPIIKTFIYNNNYYFYDTYTNRIIQVTKPHYVELTELEHNGISVYSQQNKDSTYYKDIQMLMKKGMLKSSFIKNIQREETEYIQEFITKGINDISLQITRDCNFNCRYCMFANESKIDRNHEKVNMSWNIAKASIDFVYKNSGDIKFINMAFYGGEPLLNFQLIKKVVDYVNELFITKKIIYSMTTNASVLTDEIIEFLAKNKFRLSISLDGPEEIQNKHRKFLSNGRGTFDIVYDNLKKLKEKAPNYFQEHVNFLPVILIDEDHNNVLSFFNSLGIKEEQIHFLDADFSGNDYYYNDYNIIADSYFSRNELLLTNIEKRLKESYFDKGVLPTTWHHGGMCIPGVRRLFVDANGVFYPCEKIINRKYLSIGNLSEGINLNKVNEFMNIGKLTEKECKNCWAVRFCEICAMFCFDVERDIITKEQKNRACKYQKSRALAFIKKYIDDYKYHR